MIEKVHPPTAMAWE